MSMMRALGLSKLTFAPSHSSRPKRLPQSAPEHPQKFLGRDQDTTFFQQVREVIAARLTFDEIYQGNLVGSFRHLATYEARRTREYRQNCARNDWKMNLVDLVHMEETTFGQMNPGVRDLTRHTQLKPILKVIRRKVETDATSKSPRLTSEERKEIKLYILKFKDAENGFPNCSHWNKRHGRLGCQNAVALRSVFLVILEDRRF